MAWPRILSIPEIVVDGETGLLVPLGDLSRFALDLAGQVNRLLADPEWAARLGRAGRRRVLERFTWTEVARRTVGLYRKLLA